MFNFILQTLKDIFQLFVTSLWQDFDDLNGTNCSWDKALVMKPEIQPSRLKKHLSNFL